MMRHRQETRGARRVFFAIACATVAATIVACHLFTPDKAREAVGEACKVVDLAKEACTVISYLTPDGKVAQVRVSREELTEFGMAMQAKQTKAAAAAGASASASTSSKP